MPALKWHRVATPRAFFAKVEELLQSELPSSLNLGNIQGRLPYQKYQFFVNST